MSRVPSSVRIYFSKASPPDAATEADQLHAGAGQPDLLRLLGPAQHIQHCPRHLQLLTGRQTIFLKINNMYNVCILYSTLNRMCTLYYVKMTNNVLGVVKKTVSSIKLKSR